MRTAYLGVVVLVMACAGGADAPHVPESMLILDDSTGRIISSAIPSPDGAHIAYARVVGGGRSQIFVSAPDGSDPVQVSHGVWDINPVWSPDGKWIAYQGEDPDFDLYVVPSDGSGPAKLYSAPGVDNPITWSNDGSAVLVSRSGAGDDHPMLMPVDGATPRRIGPVMQGDMHAMFSPDGAQLGWDVHQGAGGTIWVQEMTAGGAPRQLTSEGFENGAAQTMWSPDGKEIAYTSRRTGTDDIWILDVENGQARQVTNDIRDDFSPRWSPDGQSIAFISDRGGQRDLWLVPSAGGNPTRLTNDAATENSHRWSLDGKALYYTSLRNEAQLQLVPIAGGEARTVRAWDEFIIGSARLSPDGKTIAYDSPTIGNGDIFLLPVAGGEPTVFASSPLADSVPRWSPDGTQIAFVSSRGGSTDIWVAPVGGGEARNLTASPGAEGEPYWSPDGTQIAFASNRDVGRGDLWVIPSSGGTPKRLTHDNVVPGAIQWSPDGQYVYFTANKGGGGDRDYYRVRPDGGRVESLGANPRVGVGRLSHDGKQLVYSTTERGWAFTNLMPAGGGPTRRITTDTTQVYQPAAFWSLGDSLLVVLQLDLAANRDYADVFTYRLSDGRWQRLTNSMWYNDAVSGITPDGTDLLVILRGQRGQIRRVTVPEFKAP